MLLLDTHAWLWWADDPSRLSGRARAAIERSDRLGVSAISAWEVGMLVSKRRISLSPEPWTWVRRALTLPGVEAIPLEPRAAIEATELPDAIGDDPADRLIYATARARGATLVTRDQRLREFDPRGTLW